MAPLHTTASSSPFISFQELSEVALGIDLGSTSTRAYLWCPKTKNGWCVESKSRARTGHRFSNGDFSSIGYPFDGGEVYLGEGISAARESISLKYAFYALVNTTDELFNQYRLATPLLSRRNDQEFRARLLEGIRKLFTAVYDRVVEVCQEEKLRVTTIGLSIPSQWTLDFMDLYRDLVAQVFRHDSSAIFFVTETEALAHFLCVKKLDRLVVRQNTVHHDVVLMLDFGGHNMNTCTLNIVYGRDRAPAFYLIGEPDGAGGGSELWEYLAAERSLEFAQHVYDLAPSALIRQNVLDSFNGAKGGCGPGFPGEDFDCTVKDQYGRRCNIFLDEADITACFNEAMKLPLDLAAARIEEVTRLLTSQKQAPSTATTRGPKPVGKPRVILAGGTARHEGLRRKVEAVCQKNNISDPVLTDNIMIQYDSAKIASGAAFAVASPLTVESFVRRGAAFGLQMRQKAKRGETESEHQWDDTASFLLSWRRTVKNFEIYIRPNDELKIVCDPFFEDESNENKDLLHYHRSYDIVDLGRPTMGHWWFTLALTGHGDDMSLTIERSRQPPRVNAGVPCEPVTVPLYYNKGSNSIHIGEEGYDANKHISRLKQYPERDQKRTSKKRPLLAADFNQAAQVLDTELQPMSKRGACRDENHASDDPRAFSFINHSR
ncbi:hypothetical protein BJ170DRAFT_109899 [Xylariales sp. AK1849]|nr:hypothetical protein BJ170DRAFT_109899 [Xylariales sp. AK1849]